MIQENLEEVRRRIQEAAQNCGRDPAQIRLIAVTKTVPVQRIREALSCGLTELGENRVQEAQEKQRKLDLSVRWHLVGHLQRNKAKLAAKLFDCIHSIDSVELIQLLDQAAQSRSLPLVGLIQVNVSGESAQHGAAPEEAGPLLDAMLGCKHLKCGGLMTLAPWSDEPEKSRTCFRQLRELRDNLQENFFRQRPTTNNVQLGLSMGMSQDFEVAIEEGATWIRIGTALFGERLK